MGANQIRVILYIYGKLNIRVKEHVLGKRPKHKYSRPRRSRQTPEKVDGRN